MTFRGWPAAAVEFFEGLEADNTRSYWHARKPVYDDMVRGPMEALIAELEPEFGTGRVFRPNRDTRFSADKSPYKTAIAASFARGGYVQFSADGLGVGRMVRIHAAVHERRPADLQRPAGGRRPP